MYICVYAVCTKGPRFPYIRLTTQKVCVYFIAMIILCYAPAQCMWCEHSTYMRVKYYIFANHKVLHINSTDACLYGTIVIFAYEVAKMRNIYPRKF